MTVYLIFALFSKVDCTFTLRDVLLTSITNELYRRPYLKLNIQFYLEDQWVEA